MKFRQAQENASFKKKLREELERLIEQDAPAEEVVELCQQHMTSTSLTDVDITVMVSLSSTHGSLVALVSVWSGQFTSALDPDSPWGVYTILSTFLYLDLSLFPLLSQLWRCIMGSVEWNKKEELVAEQALKYLKVQITSHYDPKHTLGKWVDSSFQLSAD